MSTNESFYQFSDFYCAIDPEKRHEFKIMVGDNIRGKGVVKYDHVFGVLEVLVYRYLSDLEIYAFIGNKIKNANATDEDCFKAAIGAFMETKQKTDVIFCEGKSYRVVTNFWEPFHEHKVSVGKYAGGIPINMHVGSVLLGEINKYGEEISSHRRIVCLGTTEKKTLLDDQPDVSRFISEESYVQMLQEGIELIHTELLQELKGHDFRAAKADVDLLLKQREEIQQQIDALDKQIEEKRKALSELDKGITIAEEISKKENQ